MSTTELIELSIRVQGKEIPWRRFHRKKKRIGMKRRKRFMRALQSIADALWAPDPSWSAFLEATDREGAE